ncbi:hypothetical protein [Paracoccus sp. ME4]|uniref:hypothetical protein n=1 Tax=Paracoccus sp. ME4 TaxID=3138066 RepID=UPI00398B51B2
MDANKIISEIEDYSTAAGLKPSTVCQRAFGNARYLDRLSARLGRLADEHRRFRQFVAKNPPLVSAELTQPSSVPPTSNQETPHDQPQSDAPSDAA